MMNHVQSHVTYIVFVDKYDQLLEKKQVPSDRTHHLQHPDQIPPGAAACRYYDHTTELGIDDVTYHNECNHSPWIPLRQLASAS